MEDLYHIPKNSSEGFYKEKASKFYAYLSHVQSIEDIDIELENIKKIHPKARHICYAYRLDPDSQVFRINDDGEPSGTAGKPIYNQILSAELHEVLIAVVRYFGGTKLGASGLIRAYKTGAQEATENCGKIDKYPTINCRIEFPYDRMGDIMNIVKGMNLEIIEKNFDLSAEIIVQLRESASETQINTIKAKLLYRDLADITEETEIESFSFELIES